MSFKKSQDPRHTLGVGAWASAIEIESLIGTYRLDGPVIWFGLDKDLIRSVLLKYKDGSSSHIYVDGKLGKTLCELNVLPKDGGDLIPIEELNNKYVIYDEELYLIKIGIPYLDLTRSISFR